MGLGALATRLGATALKQAVALTARAALAAARKMAQKLFTSARAVSARIEGGGEHRNQSGLPGQPRNAGGRQHQ